MLQITVINIDYRLAPEFPFPAGVHDAYDSVKYIHDNANKYCVDPCRMAIGGHSAGGNISTVVCMMAKRKGEFKLKCQILDYPPLDIFTSAYKKPLPKGAIPPEIADMYNSCYCKPEERALSYVSPLYAKPDELNGLPSALVITAELDSLKAEAEHYAKKLKKAGVNVEYHNYKDVTHGFTISAFSPLPMSNDIADMKTTIDAATDALNKIAAFLQKYLK